MSLKSIILFAFAVVVCLTAVSCGGGGDKHPEESGGKESMMGEQTEFLETAKEGDTEFTLDASGVRNGIVDYMRSMATVEWTPSENFSLNGDHNTWGVNLNFKKGTSYLGLPYTRAFSDLETFSQYIEDGVYKGPCGSYDTMPGNNCSSSCDLSWRRYLISTTEATYTYVPGYGNKTVTAVGDYDYPSNNRDTFAIIEANSQDDMFEAYSLVKPADAIVKWSNKNAAGHARMVCAEATVMRNAQGKINGGRSYITVIEQTNKLTTVNGKETTWLVDKVYTFSQLLADGYVPVTPVALADGGVETPKITLKDGNTSKDITASLKGTVEFNYNVNRIELLVTDSVGVYVKSYDVEVENGTSKVSLRKYTFNLDIASLPEGSYKYKITAHTPCLGSVMLQELSFDK